MISDEDNLLNDYEAIVKCVTHAYDGELFDLNFGSLYKAIGRDKDGMYLVMDESFCCYFYDPNCFEVVEDKYGILDKHSVYYSYGGGDEIQKN